MKNILLALASFLMASMFLFQVANAQQDTWEPRDKANPAATTPERGTADDGYTGEVGNAPPGKTIGNITSLGNDPANCCVAQTVGEDVKSPKLQKLPTKGGSGSSSDTTGSKKAK
jgi:hypothetical protein